MILLGPIDAEHAHLSRPSHEGTWLLKASRPTCKFGGGPPDHVAQWLRACHLPKDHVWAARSKWRATFADSRSSLHCVAVGLEHVALMLDLDLLGVDAIAESLGTVLACCKLLSNKADASSSRILPWHCWSITGIVTKPGGTPSRAPDLHIARKHLQGASTSKLPQKKPLGRQL